MHPEDTFALSWWGEEKHKKPSSHAVCWAAGLFEGEGWFGPRAKTSAEAVVGMTDQDVIERFAAIMGFGSITVEPRGENKILYRWCASGAEDVRTLIKWFWPYLGGRRRARARLIWEHTENCPGTRRTRTKCRKGHPYSEINTYTVPKSGYRQCRICKRENTTRRSVTNG